MNHLLTRLPLAVVLACAALPGATAAADNAAVFTGQIQPLMGKYCIECHREDKHKGDLNIQRFTALPMVVESLGVWQRMAKRIESHEMPPKSVEIQPTDAERVQLIQWIGQLEPDNADCDQIASEESTSWYPGYVMSRRLNRFEYENSVQDLLGIDMDLADIFPADGAGGEGFDNNGNALFLSAIQMEKYLATAERVIETVFAVDERGMKNGSNRGRAVAGERELSPEEEAQARTLRKLITATPGRGTSKHDAALRVCLDFTERAWRRPVSPEEMDGLMALFDKASERGSRYHDAIQLPLKAALMSPNFLFLAEPEPSKDGGGEYALGDYPLASRLSYFLWGTMPDAELFNLAGQGLLQNPEVLKQQVTRMLKSAKSKALGDLFATQWLGISQLGEIAKPDENRYPDFDEAMADSEREEAAMLFHHVIAENGSLLDLINSDYTYVNEALAGIYGIEGVEGPQMRRVQLADARRGGVLGMAAVLTATSHPLRTSPVLRGKWVLEQLLGERVPPPPPNVPQLPEDEQHLEGLSLRQRLEEHRKNPECASCHQTMDPIGFGLENFDPVGRWREDQAGLAIDSNGTLPNGESFNGPQELKNILLKRKDDFARNLSRKMLGYALGRSLTKFDECVVNDCVAALQADEYRPENLFQHIVLSHPFRYRYSARSAK